MFEKIEKVVEKLMNLGLSEYEAKVYSALVGLGKATAREVHEASGVPRSRVYDVLQKLAEKGFVDVEDGDTKRFSAVQPDRAIGRIREEFIRTADECIEELEALSFKSRQTFSPALIIRGERNIIERIRDIISESREEVVIVTTNGELVESVFDALKNTDAKVLCYVVGLIKIPKIGKKAEIWEVTDLSPILKKMYLEGMEEGKVKARIEAIFVSDSRKSFIVINESGERMGLLITLPIIAYVQSNMIKVHLSEIAKRVS
jgi:sugar-specific transcriptional regulator TrmB